MIRHALAAALALTAVLHAPAAVFADPAPGARAHHHHQRFQQKLGLTDDQMQQIRAIRAGQRDAVRQVHQALRQARAELRQLALGGADDATVQAKTQEVTTLQGQAVALRVEALRQIAPILTEEQRAKLAQMGAGHRHHGPKGARPQQQS
jgi:Spy/CpxP family protein refolding chaperone